MEKERAPEHGVDQRRSKNGERHFTPDVRGRILEPDLLRLVWFEH